MTLQCQQVDAVRIEAWAARRLLARRLNLLEPLFVDGELVDLDRRLEPAHGLDSHALGAHCLLLDGLVKHSVTASVQAIEESLLLVYVMLGINRMFGLSRVD